MKALALGGFHTLFLEAWILGWTSFLEAVCVMEDRLDSGTFQMLKVTPLAAFSGLAEGTVRGCNPCRPAPPAAALPRRRG